MGAALHLAHVQQMPVRKRKRKGGGGEGDGYDALQEVATKHRWDEHRVKYVREMRALLAPITNTQSKEEG